MKTRAILTALLLAACGDDQHATIDSGATPDAAPVAHQAIVVAGDFTAGHPGILSKLDLATMTVTQNAAPAGSVGDDPMIRKLGNELFVVNRADGNSITILDAATLGLVEQLGTGAGSNPQDVAAVGQKLYVPTFSGKGLAILTRGTTTMTTVDLADGQTDGNPDCVSAVAAGSDVFVACGHLDASFNPRGMGKVYVIDTATDAIRTTVTMQHPNPFGVFEQAPMSSMLHGDLVIAADPFGAGCVERIAIGAAPASNGCVTTDAQLKGYASRIDFQTLADSSVMMMMAVALSDFTNANLQGYDTSSSSLWATALSPATEVVADAVACPNNTIVIADHHKTAANGLRVYVNMMETTTAPLPVGLDPQATHGLVCY